MITATCCKITKKEITVLQFLRWGDMSTIKRFTVSPANFRNIIWSDATKMSMKRNDFYVVCDIHLKIWRSVFQSRASFWISNGYQRLKGIPYNFKSYWKVSEQNGVYWKDVEKYLSVKWWIWNVIICKTCTMFEKRTYLSFKISCPFSLPELIAEKRVKVLSNVGTWPFRKGDNKQIAKKHW